MPVNETERNIGRILYLLHLRNNPTGNKIVNIFADSRCFFSSPGLSLMRYKYK